MGNSRKMDAAAPGLKADQRACAANKTKDGYFY
jgi:hypothetical protein